MSKMDDWSEEGRALAEEFSQEMDRPVFRYKVYAKCVILLILFIVLLIMIGS